jgi:glycyl-tRNA synthetase beta chain
VAKRLIGSLPQVTEVDCVWSVLDGATTLAKADLTTELVKEFTELQGIIGGLYARAQGRGDEFANRVAQAIYDQYRPASAEDSIPSTSEGQLLGLADRIQTVTAMFGKGFAPTGSKDPFALRRAANGIVKILAESDLPLSLASVLNAAASMEASRQQLDSFFRERLHFYLKDVRGFAYDVVNAVLADCTVVMQTLDVRGATALASAIAQIRDSEDFRSICQNFKRIKNIQQQAAGIEEMKRLIRIVDGDSDDSQGPQSTSIRDERRLIEPAGVELSETFNRLAPVVAKLTSARNYTSALDLIATLGPAIGIFFEKVMVMSPEPELRGARVALIRRIFTSFSRIADFSEVVTS